MKIQLATTGHFKFKTDLLVVILDEEYTFHDLTARLWTKSCAAWAATSRTRSSRRNLHPLDFKAGPKHLLVYSAFSTSQRLGK